jgi:hypothetical protein
LGILRKGVRAVCGFLLNLVVAAIGTNIVESPYVYLTHPSGMSRGAVLREDLLTSVTAFGLGFFVYWKWQPIASKWLWLAGVCWFGWRALVALDGRHGLVLWELSASGIAFSLDRLSFENWGGYTLPFLRTVFYSVGAFCCSYLLRYRTRSRAG